MNKTLEKEHIALVTIIDKHDLAEHNFQFSEGFLSILSPCNIKLAMIIAMLLPVMLFHS